MKKIIALLLSLIFICSFTAFANDTEITVIVNGSKVESDVPATIVDGRTLLPVRAIFEALGMVVSWNGETQTAKGVGYDYTVMMTIGSPVVKFYLATDVAEGDEADLEIEADVPPQIIDGRTFVPVRALAEALESRVEWDDAKKTVTIEKLLYANMTEDNGYMIDGNTARFIGRYYEKDGYLTSSFSASGIELRFKGTGAKLKVEVTGNQTAYVHTFIDGDKTVYTNYTDDEKVRIELKKGENEFVIAENLEDGIHTVKILKDNQEQYNHIRWISVEIENGKLLSPAPAKSRKIQVYGDSFTCASNSVNYPDNNDSSSLGSKYENANNSYASFIARNFDAELEIVARNGFSIYSSFSSLKDPLYNHVSLNAPQLGVWDHAKFEPDLIIQYNWINDVVGKIDRDGLSYEDIKKVYINMLTAFREAHPNASIIIMGCVSRPLFTTAMNEAIEEYGKEYDNSGIMVFESQIPYGRHPLSEKQQQIAEELYPVIEAFMGW